MTIEYYLDTNDYLNHYMYSAESSVEFQKRIKRNQYLFFILYAVFAGWFFSNQNVYIGILFIVFAILWLIFYPRMVHRRYKKYYQRYISENITKTLDQQITLQIEDDYILGKEEGIEGKVETSHIHDITELPTILLIKIDGAQSIVIPKHQLKDLSAVTTKLRQIADHFDFPYIELPDWHI